MLTKVALRRFRRRIGTEHLLVSGSVRRPLERLWAQLNTANPAEVQRDFISQSRLNPVQQDKRMKPAPKEKECRALMLSRQRRSASSNSNNYRNNSNSTGGRCSNNNSKEVARPLQP